MSGSNNLEIKISAQDSASAIIQKLTASVQTLTIALNYAANASTTESAAAVNSYRQQIAAAEQLIEAMRSRGAAQQEVIASLRNEGETASQVYARMQEDAVSAERAKQQAIKETILARRAAMSAEERAAANVAAPRIQSVSRSGLGSAAATVLSGEKAAEAAKAFQQLTDFEKRLGDKSYTVAFAAEQERIAEATKKAMQAMEREIYTARQLREELAIPPGGSFGRMDQGATTGMPRWLARQRNAPGEEGESEGSGQSHGGGGGGARAGVGGLNRELGHVVAGFDELARGSRGAFLSTLGAAARDAGLGVGALGTSVALLGVAMAGAAIMRHAEELGEWATQVKAAASATGMSLQAYSGLEASLRGLGLSSTEADASLRRISATLGEAIADPASKAAEAYHNMGISQEQLAATGGDTEKGLRLLADAYARTADGANKTANMNEIAGRGFEKLVPLIQNGSGAMDEMTARAKALGTTLDESGAAKLEAAGNAVRDLGETIRGQGISSMEAWGPVIIETANALEGLIRIAGSALSILGNIVSFGGTVIQTANDLGVSMAHALGQKDHPEWRAKTSGGIGSQQGAEQYGPPAPKQEVAPLTTPISALEQMRANVAQAEAAAAAKGGKPADQHMAETTAAINAMKQTLATAQLTASQRLQIETEVAQKTVTLENEKASAAAKAASAGTAAAKRAAKQSYEDFASSEKLKISEAQGDSGAITAIYDEWAQKAGSTYKQQANVIMDIERQKTKFLQEEAKKQQEAQLKAIKEAHTQEQQSQQVVKLTAEAQVMAEGRMGKGQTGQQATTPQQYIAEAQGIESSFQTYKAQLQQVADTAQQGGEVQKAAQEAIMAETISAKTQEIALYQKAAEAAEKAAEKMAAPFTKMFDSMGSQFESLTGELLNDVISPQVDIIKQGLSSIKVNEGSTQIHQAFRKFALDLVDQGVKAIEGAVSHSIATSIDSSIQGGIGELLGKTMSNLFQSAISSVVGNTAGQAAGSVVGSVASSAVGGAAGQAVGSAAGQAVGGAAGAAVADTATVTAITASTTAITGAITATGATQVAAITAMSTTITGAIVSTASVEDSLLAATAVKPEALGFSYAGGGIVPSAAGGMVAGNGATLARLHFQEMVLPAHLSNGIQTMINNGGAKSNANLNYSPTINTGGRTSRGGSGMTRAEFGQMMATHGGAMMGEARNMVRNGFRAG